MVLVIQSYFSHHTDHVMHVVILDDGLELHVRSVDVVPVLLLHHSDSAEQVVQPDSVYEMQDAGAVEESRDMSRSTPVISATMPSMYTETVPDQEDTGDNEVDDSWMSWVQCEEELQLPCSANTVPSSDRHTGGLSSASWSFAEVFGDVFSDGLDRSVAPPLSFGDFNAENSPPSGNAVDRHSPFGE